VRIGTRTIAAGAPRVALAWPALLALALQLPVLALTTLRPHSLERALAAYLPAGPGRSNAADLTMRVEIALEVVESATGERELAVSVGARKFQVRGELGIDAVAERLFELRDDDPRLALTLTPGPDLRCDEVERVLDRVRAAGFTDVAFGSAHRRGGPRSTR
jgi:hypothetical protein